MSCFVEGGSQEVSIDPVCKPPLVGFNCSFERLEEKRGIDPRLLNNIDRPIVKLPASVASCHKQELSVYVIAVRGGGSERGQATTGYLPLIIPED
jgi:hypothetical protein